MVNPFLFFFICVLLVVVVKFLRQQHLNLVTVLSLFAFFFMILTTILARQPINTFVDWTVGINNFSWFMYATSLVMATTLAALASILAHHYSQKKKRLLVFMTGLSASCTLLLLFVLCLTEIFHSPPVNWGSRGTLPRTLTEFFFILSFCLYPVVFGLAPVLVLRDLSVKEKTLTTRIRMNFILTAATTVYFYFVIRVFYVIFLSSHIEIIQPLVSFFSVLLNALVAFIFASLALAYAPQRFIDLGAKLLEIYRLRKLCSRLSEYAPGIAKPHWWKALRQPSNYIYWATIYISDTRKVLASYVKEHEKDTYPAQSDKRAFQLNQALTRLELEELSNFHDLVAAYCQISTQIR